MTTDTSNKILGYIRTNRQARVIDLVRDIKITNAAVHRQLNKLLAKGALTKVGKPPMVFYILKVQEQMPLSQLSKTIEDFINKSYVYVSPVGEFLEGMEGFGRWVGSNHQEKFLSELAQEYIKVRTAADNFIKPHGWINATVAKERATFGKSAVDTLLYKDFYSIEKFGKTKLGQMVLYAKISQNRTIITALIEQVKPTVDRVLKKYAIDTIAYIPPSVKRSIQLMTELKNGLQIHLPEIVLVKAYTGDIIVSQKSQAKLSERIANARDTIFVDVNKSAASPKNVLLIDDAVGSGATIHETAKKIEAFLHPTGHIVAFAIVGSMKGFEVIREI